MRVRAKRETAACGANATAASKMRVDAMGRAIRATFPILTSLLADRNDPGHALFFSYQAHEPMGAGLLGLYWPPVVVVPLTSIPLGEPVNIHGRACLMASTLSAVILNSISIANGSPSATPYSPWKWS